MIHSLPLWPREHSLHPKIPNSKVRGVVWAASVNRGPVTSKVAQVPLPVSESNRLTAWVSLSLHCVACSVDVQEIGRGDPDEKHAVDGAAPLRDVGDPLNPGVKFGYWGSKAFFMKNIGSSCSYRSARQLLLDAEAAMLTTISTERWRLKSHHQQLLRQKLAAMAEAETCRALLHQIIKEKEVGALGVCVCVCQ